jgi:hypothetical protein
MAVCLLSSVALGDTIVGGGAAGWQSFSAADVNNNGTPYWDNVSSDGAGVRNAGSFLTASGFYTGGTNYLGSSPQYWGNADGTADPNFYFINSSQHNLQLLLEAASNFNINRFGWYKLNANGTPGTRYQIFGGANDVGDTASITIPAGTKFGFYLGRGSTLSPRFYTQSSFNTPAESGNNFSLFRDKDDPNCYFFGIEDLTSAEIKGREGTYGDFNDMVIKVQAVVPLPASVILMISGLACLCGLKKYRKP